MAGHLASTFYMYGVVLLYDKIGDEINDIKELESFREQLLDIASKIIQMPKQTVATMAGLYNGGVLLNEVGLTGYITNNMVGVETGDDSDLDLTYKMMAKIEGYIDSLEI
ncbi:MAG: hypothetical protein LBK93_04200 [Rickettsiales bacterium]|nr:hypothetical protein [Rickettsiales bacterium]